MVSLLRLALGNAKILVSEVFTTSLIVSLVTGATALTNIIKGYVVGEVFGLWNYLLISVYEELRLITYLWSIPIWVLVLIAIYLMSNYLSYDLIPTYVSLIYIGASRRFTITLLLLRYFVVAFLSWLIGLSLGLTASQVMFRFTAYVLHAPYEIPYLDLSDVVELAVITNPLILLGSIPTLIKVIRCRY